MGEREKRRAKRIEINARIKLHSVSNPKFAPIAPKVDEFEVDVVNISKGGMAFKCQEFLRLNSFYEAKVLLWTKETFDALVEIIRMESIEDDDCTMYGCRFVGISASDQFKIEVYQIVSES